ncbi:ParA family protein [Neptuniibacter halophilus]|uniref:ParA family protein n=1 Tax=Neptuniibacter halophilus TaxID=651666 RepID=UPI002574057D|nr:ParA family protein [Neptuniibacter halophilus]
MTKVLTIANNKGGVGKTTTVQVTAAHFSRAGKRVLVVDMDPQCNFTSAMLDVNYGEEGVEYLPYHPDHEGHRFDIANIFLEEDLDPYPTTLPNVDIIPCKPVNIELDKQGDELIDVFVDFLHQEAVEESYDLVIIDTPPAKGMLTSAAIRAATHVLIPIVLERKSVEGLLGMVQKVHRENEYKTPDRYSHIIGVLPNKVDARYRIHKDYLNQLNDPDEISTIASLMIPRSILNQGSSLASFVIKERPALKEMDLRNATPNTPFAMSKSTDIFKEWNALGKFLEKEMGIC